MESSKSSRNCFECERLCFEQELLLVSPKYVFIKKKIWIEAWGERYVLWVKEKQIWLKGQNELF
jgi:hypothetical protein